MNRKNFQATVSSCKKKCDCTTECGCNPCNRNYRYHDMYCPASDGQGCGSQCGMACKCYVINSTVTLTPATLTAVGQSVLMTFRIQNVGNLPLCGQILICLEINGVRSKLQVTDRRETFLPVGATIVVEKTYTSTAADFVVSTPPLRNRARVFVQADDINWVRAPEMPLPLAVGGADLFATLTQTASGTTATATATLGVLAGSSAVPATNARLVLAYPAGINAMTVGTGNVTVDDTARTVTLAAPTLALGETQVFTFTYTVVSGSAYSLSGSATSDVYDPNTANNFVSSTVIVP